MWYDYTFFQQGHGNLRDSSQEKEQSPQGSSCSEGIASPQEGEKNTDPWSRIQDEVWNHHEAQLKALVNEYEQHRGLSEVVRVKAANALLPVYSKELRKVLLDYLQRMHAMKKDSTNRKLMETRDELKDTEGCDWLESTELAIDKRKFLLNRFFVKQPVPKD